MKINIIVNSTDTALIDSPLQLWDFYYAYNQFLNRDQNYYSGLDITISPLGQTEPDAVNVGWFFMPENPVPTDKFDIVIVDAMHAQLEACSEAMYNAIVGADNCYYVSGSYLDLSHPLKNKIIWMPQDFNMLSYFARPFYPQYFEKSLLQKNNKGDLIYINGQNRPHRQFFMECMEKFCPDIKIRDSIPTDMFKLKFSFFESSHDTEFRKFVNTSTSFNPHIMFIAKPTIAKKWFSKLFSWLFRCEKVFGFHNLSGYDTTRLYAYLAERYLSFWFKKYTKYIEWPVATLPL
jgi:hypothetical protein